MGGARLQAVILLAWLAALAAGAQDVRGYVCAAVVPEGGGTVFDFTRSGSSGDALWRYRYEGDSAVSVVRRGQGLPVRESYSISGDAAMLTGRECRVWASADSVPVVSWHGSEHGGAIARRVRRYLSEHYVVAGRSVFEPVCRCSVILAEGDTARSVTLTHRREITEVMPTDLTYTERGDSLCAEVTKDIWNWGYGPGMPLLACTEVTVTRNLHTGETTRDEWTAVFPRRDNPDVWGGDEDGAARTRAAHGGAGKGVRQGVSGPGRMPPGAGEPLIETGRDGVSVSCPGEGTVTVTVTDVAGRVMHACEARGTVTIGTGGWPYGEYVIKAGDTVRKIILVP